MTFPCRGWWEVHVVDKGAESPQDGYENQKGYIFFRSGCGTVCLHYNLITRRAPKKIDRPAIENGAPGRARHLEWGKSISELHDVAGEEDGAGRGFANHEDEGSVELHYKSVARARRRTNESRSYGSGFGAFFIEFHTGFL